MNSSKMRLKKKTLTVVSGLRMDHVWIALFKTKVGKTLYKVNCLHLYTV